MQQITGILFDKDGTLFDFQATWGAWAQSFLTEIAGGETARAAELGAAIGYGFEAGLFAPDSPVIAGTPDEAAELLLPLLPGTDPAALIARMNDAAARAPMREAAPLAALMTRLAGMGLKLGVATNDAEAPARAHLAAAGVDAHFDFIAGCDSGFGAKPAPGQLLAFAEVTGLAPASVLMVGDSRHDLAAGRAAGMGTVAVLTGPARAGDLADLADAVLPDIGHLPEYLRHLRGRGG
ncbi:HAD family hydrolase [Actibacterium sp. MT2.3-13A]|uniref:HAD family hydrolase n=1 Tax=Actibacterium sp. MT2.3-13A TaxID=2828332 RepID=UPI001BABDDAE|nr:HAD family hydrolase [Actibacterium sp. MT2.3-13A]